MNKIQFTGAISDSSTGLYYMNARYYNADTGRFITQDSYKGSAYEPWTQNLYTYTGNNPVNFIDPTGHMAAFIEDDGSGGAGVTPGDDGAGQGSSTTSGGLVGNDDIAQATMGGATALMTYDMLSNFYYANQNWAMSDGPLVFGDGAYLAGLALVFGGETIGYLAYYASSLGPEVASQISNAVKNIASSGGAMPPGDPENGFRSFRLLKKYLGSAGKGNEWHHIVEQSQINKSGFSKYEIHNVNNVIKLDEPTHRAISSYYSSKPKWTGGLRVRDWLAQNYTFEQQYQFGINTLKDFGVTIP